MPATQNDIKFSAVNDFQDAPYHFVGSIITIRYYLGLICLEVRDNNLIDNTLVGVCRIPSGCSQSESLLPWRI